MTLRLAICTELHGEYHAGNDAMLSAALDALRLRGECVPVVVGGRQDVPSAPSVDFNNTPGTAFDRVREMQLASVLDPTDPSGADFRRTFDGVDAVLVAGGGSLSAGRPHLLYERVAAAALATARGLPVVISGQTVGPLLTELQGKWLGSMFGAADFVGVRDQASLQLVERLGATAARLHVDDGALLSGEPISHVLPPEYVALVVHPFEGASTSYLESLARFVRHVHRSTSQPVVLFPTTGSFVGPSSSGSDVGLAGLISDCVADPAVCVAAPLLTARQLATAMRAASTAISTRVHPLSFALSGHVPSIGLFTDRHSSVQLGGALSHAGLDTWQLPMLSVASGSAAALFDECWARRDELRNHLATVVPVWTEHHRVRWDAIWEALSGTMAEVPASVPVVSSLPSRELTVTPLREVAAEQQAHEEGHLDRFDEAERYALSLRDLVAVRETEIAALQQRMADQQIELAEARAEHTRLADDAAHSQAATAAAQQLTELLSASFMALPHAGPPKVEASSEAVDLRRELDALRATRVFRWTTVPRGVYRRIRRLLGRT